MSRKILIIDDNATNNAILAKRLEKNAFNVITTETCEKGLSLATTEIPDLILLDLVLPDMTGWELIETIRTLNSINHIPVIAVSSTISDLDRDRLEFAGFNGYCVKPIKASELVRKIPKWLSINKK
ncbi:response regulator [Oligoflexaceae bacterium]|nr:response regulator [Oligoflexaceae bacterium]